jgi:hypothetical protein
MWSPKVNKIISFLVEIWLIAIIINALVRHGLPDSPVFWVAFVIEVILGVITYQVFRRYLADKSVRRWHLLHSLLTIIGFVAPIILFCTVDFLKPAGGTWVFYLLTVNSFYIYRIITKQPMTRQDVSVSSGKILSVVRTIYLVSISGIFIMVFVVILLAILGNTPVFGEKIDLEIAFSIVFIPFLIFGLFLPSIARLIWKGERSEIFVFHICLIRSSLFMSTATLGLVMGILDGFLYMSLPLMLLAGGAMVLTFPTERRWEELKTGHKVQYLDNANNTSING